MPQQFQLFDISPVQIKGPAALRFEAFHLENPHILRAILRLALDMQGRGIKRLGMAAIFEQLRWLWMLQTSGDSEYKLNNNYRAFYARLAMAVEPRLAGFFPLRVQTDEWSPDDMAVGWRKRWRGWSVDGQEGGGR